MKNLLIALIALFTFASCNKLEKAQEDLTGETYSTSYVADSLNVTLTVDFTNETEGVYTVDLSSPSIVANGFIVEPFTYTLSETDEKRIFDLNTTSQEMQDAKVITDRKNPTELQITAWKGSDDEIIINLQKQ